MSKLVKRITESYPKVKQQLDADESLVAWSNSANYYPNDLQFEPYDNVNKPSHYNYGDIEVIDYIEQVTNQYDGYNAYLVGNVLKYISRAPHKNKQEDLEKAKVYLDKMVMEWND